MTSLIQLHADFWEFRDWMEPYWMTPTFADAARFAQTEAAEVLKTCGLWQAFVAFAASRQAMTKAGDALDAVLRRNPSYSRNTVREIDERSELADLAMMLLTAMGSADIMTGELYFRRSDQNVQTPTVDTIATATSLVHQAATSGKSISAIRQFALRALDQIDRYPEMDLPTVLQIRMNRIYLKHHPEPEPA